MLRRRDVFPVVEADPVAPPPPEVKPGLVFLTTVMWLIVDVARGDDEILYAMDLSTGRVHRYARRDDSTWLKRAKVIGYVDHIVVRKEP